MNLVAAFLAGLVFGVGLVASAMVDPAKVLGFLDIGGNWDPSLAFVMIGAIAVGLIAFAVARHRAKSLLGLPMQLPTSSHIDRRLIGGSILFGLGWGLAGICPGPALVLVGVGVTKGWIFCAAMLAGMLLFEWLERTAGAPPERMRVHESRAR